MIVLASAAWPADLGRSLRESFFMFWETLWPLALGFGISGAVQAFVSDASMQRSMGNHRPAAVGRASTYGMVSSSCSYAASAMSKSLFVKGADFVSANVFMLASTNLVVELGIVLAVLVGWQFAVSEFVGGIIMIVLFVALGSLWLRGRQVVDARRHLARALGGGDHVRGPLGDPVLQHQSWRVRLRYKAGWAESATYTISDISMLRNELVIGYLVAGFLSVLVPAHIWNALFWHGHGTWTAVENVIVGPLIAIVSFVCSVGNVPLAAALWSGGISFGGVISFIFADLIALPLLLIYRRYYGSRLMLRMLALFWLTMSLAGLATEGLFRAAGLVPTIRPTQVVAAEFRWNYTTVLNIVFLGVFALLYWTYRNRERLGGGRGLALDPVCGMQVAATAARAFSRPTGDQPSFCSDRCREAFERDPQRFGGPRVPAAPPSTVTPDAGQAHPAEGVGFEPTGAEAPRLFKSRAFVRSAIPPDSGRSPGHQRLPTRPVPGAPAPRLGSVRRSARGRAYSSTRAFRTLRRCRPRMAPSRITLRRRTALGVTSTHSSSPMNSSACSSERESGGVRRSNSSAVEDRTLVSFLSLVGFTSISSARAFSPITMPS